MPAPGVPDPARKKRAALYGVLAGIAVIAAVLIGLNAAGLLQLNAKPSPAGNLKAEGSQGPTLLEAQGNQAPPALQATAPPKTDIPQNIKDWLEHLRRCENLKNDIHRDQANTLGVIQKRLLSGTGGLTVKDVDRWTDPDGTTVDMDIFKDLDKQLDAMPGKWTELSQFFWSKPPPDADCQKIADSFDQGLREIPGAINDVRKLLSGFIGTGDPTVDAQASAEADIKKIGRDHPKTLDQAFKDCEHLLTKLFIKYDTEQYFHIESDLPGGGLLMK